ncbi:integrase, catalytic region, zinc finger, CCHC-type containing protein [Tanacetum coccineum]
MSTSNQQTLAKSGASNRPLILEKGSYVPWASRFKRFLNNKQEEGEWMGCSIDIGPYARQMITNPEDPTDKIPEPISKMTEDQKVDACFEITEQERHSSLMNEFEKNLAMEGQSLVSVYERMITLVNVMDRNNVLPIQISINTKFLNSLKPEWSKYVTLTRQKYNLMDIDYDELYDNLSQFEPHVQAPKEKKVARNHDPLALVAHSNVHSSHSHASPSYSHSQQPYYVTHPSLIIDYEEDYQGDAQEDKLTTEMMNGKRNVGRQNRNQVANARNDLVWQIEKDDQIVQRVSQTESNPRKENIQCYNCNAKGHYARNCPKPKIRDAKYFRKQILLAMKDEVGGNLNGEENDFMIYNAYADDTLEDLTTAVIMMERTQPADDKGDAEPKYDTEAISEVNA